MGLIGPELNREYVAVTPVVRERQSRSVAMTLALLALVTLLDWVTGHRINMSVAYFVPITYAAWALGRTAAVVAALAAEIPTYIEQANQVSAGDQYVAGAVSTLVVRLLIYLFVAEVTTRLVRSREEARDAAERLRVAHARLEEDARAGGVLQTSALKFDLPYAPGCEVGAKVRYAQAVGGDFVDAGCVDGRLFVCVGDISGKGTPAALFTMLLKHLLQGAHTRGLRGSAAIARVNEEICGTLPPDRFVTLFYAEIDAAGGGVEYVSAGHPEAIVCRQPDQGIETVPPTGPLLGLCEMGDVVESGGLSLAIGDVMVIYSDGVTDSRTHQGARLGEDVIKGLAAHYAHLGAQEMAEAIVRDIEVMTREGERDDIAVVCVKRVQR